MKAISLRSRSRVFDLVTALALTAAAQFEMWTLGYEDAMGPMRVGPAFALLQTLPLIWRRIYPVPVLVVVTLSASTPPLIGFGENSVGLFAILIALYTVAASRPVRVAAISYVAAGLSGSLLHQLPQAEGFDPFFLLFPWIPFSAAWFLGAQMRLRRKYAAALEERAADLVTQTTIDTHRAVREERRRIARELHDVVGHNLSIIAVQSGAARMYFQSNPEQARDVLASIESLAAATLQEMQRLLALVGGGEKEGGSIPGMDDVPNLVERVRKAGYNIELQQEGKPVNLSPGLELSAYRILQEALTNIMKHGEPSNAEVRIGFGSRRLDIEVENDAPAEHVAASSSGGHGLVGIKERVALFGGEVEAGLRGRRFLVKASVPLESV